MTMWVCSAQDLSSRPVELVGAKARTLATLTGADIAVPALLCVTTEAYRDFIARTGIRDRLFLELGRKDFADMRWEEIWDASLRIRHLFVTTPLPEAIRGELRKAIQEHFGEQPVAVRSSAPGEDASGTSFAGLHESYLNVKGVESILDHVKLVWASLWSHRALLYRRELGLDVIHSTMAVAIQELVAGDASGVIFTCDPTRPSRSVIEAVHGLNEGLVDGQIDPDRWMLDRNSGAIIGHVVPVRDARIVPVGDGTREEALPAHLIDRAPLSDTQCAAVWALGRRLETHAGTPQDVEWTIREGELFILQARPITTLKPDNADGERAWYLSLERTVGNLADLREHIEGKMLPGMEADAARFTEIEPRRLDDHALADALEACAKTAEHWRREYWDSCIPFAHGMRLFGEIYTDRVRPDDPYEFIELLKDDRMLSVERNRALGEMAASLRRDSRALRTAEQGTVPNAIRTQLEHFEKRFGTIMHRAAAEEPHQTNATLLRLLVRMARAENRPSPTADHSTEIKTQTFVAAFPSARRDWARGLLDLARASYRLRDDDNVYIGRVEAEVERIADAARERIVAQNGIDASGLPPAMLAELLRDPEALIPPTPREPPRTKVPEHIRHRQLVGQPAGPGTATGRARVISGPQDLYAFEEGDILVCDAVDPTITFVVPLAKGVVERRGGMLIHGAIIAREYGLPCVTGIPHATEWIPNGANITVDGHLGIVTVDTDPL